MLQNGVVRVHVSMCRCVCVLRVLWVWVGVRFASHWSRVGCIEFRRQSRIVLSSAPDKVLFPFFL